MDIPGSLYTKQYSRISIKRKKVLYGKMQKERGRL